MSSRNKKLRNRMARQVLSGKITVAEARARLGRQVAQDRRPRREEQVYRGLEAATAAVKSVAASMPAGPVTYQDLMDAARPLTRLAVTKAAPPVRREDPRQVLKALKSWRSPLDVPAGPARPWTPGELAMLAEVDKMSDPESREGIRAGLIARRWERDLMLTRAEVDRKFARQALKAEGATPLHSAAEAEVDGADEDAARRRRERVQHEADPYLHEAPEVDRVDLAELGKLRTQATDVPEGYPPMRQVSAEDFRRAPAADGHAAYSAGYETPGRAVPVPPSTLAPGVISRPLLTDGRARPCAPEAC